MVTQVGIPINLLAYKPQQKTTALCWQINPKSIIDLTLLDFEVEVDVVNSFDSINKKVYTKDNIINFQDGTFFKAFIIDDPLLFETQNYFWRVRVNSQDYISYWSDYQEKEISKFISGLEYNVPVRVYVPDLESEIIIEQIYTTKYVMDGIVYSETDFINKLQTEYGTTIFLGSLKYDEDVKIEITPNNYIIVKMVHKPGYNIFIDEEKQNEEPLNEQELIETLETDYEIIDNVYEYVGPQEFDINKITWYEDTETAENLLPDNYVYTKTGNTNIKRIIEMYMRLIGVFKNEAIQVANNFNYKKTQDKDLYDILGCLLDYTRNIDEPFITYKYELYNLWQAYLHQGTIEAFNIIIETFYGVVPQIEILKDVVEDKWVVYEQMQLLSIDGTTPAQMDIKVGDAFYNADLNKIIIATHGSTVGNWDNADIEDINETTTYQVMENEELVSYQYIATSNGFYEGIPDVKRYYVRENSSLYTIRPNPYLYTNEYLAHNLVITVDNIYNRQLDEKIILEMLNNLKPLNVNIILNIINEKQIPYSYGTIGYYGDPMNLWGQKRIIEGE